jgi:hypothetical protein
MVESTLYVVRLWREATAFRASVRDVSRDCTVLVASPEELLRALGAASPTGEVAAATPPPRPEDRP